MRNEILRDVLAGCVGVLVVAMTIGAPSGSPAARSSPPLTRVQPVQGGIMLLPYYSMYGPTQARLPGLRQPLRPLTPAP
ncbi:MAG TPA: hypothetical protein VHY31_15465 [Streptosporangiaceae bacterium]|jgi:hypothetical protein|nr:hypothetical protein [Streptosporangiaceae bacterium]